MGSTASSAYGISKRDQLIAAYVSLELLTQHQLTKEKELQDLLHMMWKEEKKLEHRHKRLKETQRPPRKTFAQIASRLPGKLFRRMFRMPRASFFKLCKKIEEKVGSKV